MTQLEPVLQRVDADEADAIRELDKRFALAEALMKSVLPQCQLSGKDHAEVLLEFFDRVDDALDALDAANDDDDDDDDD